MNVDSFVTANSKTIMRMDASTHCVCPRVRARFHLIFVLDASIVPPLTQQIIDPNAIESSCVLSSGFCFCYILLSSAVSLCWQAAATVEERLYSCSRSQCWQNWRSERSIAQKRRREEEQHSHNCCALRVIFSIREWLCVSEHAYSDCIQRRERETGRERERREGGREKSLMCFCAHRRTHAISVEGVSVETHTILNHHDRDSKVKQIFLSLHLSLECRMRSMYKYK